MREKKVRSTLHNPFPRHIDAFLSLKSLTRLNLSRRGKCHDLEGYQQTWQLGNLRTDSQAQWIPSVVSMILTQLGSVGNVHIPKRFSLTGKHASTSCLRAASMQRLVIGRGHSAPL
uniref:Uncharacterized protein n=1 Tax=Schistocephalus solidus TaxID=70667 RepID=A0A0X3Q3X2_SCHSO